MAAAASSELFAMSPQPLARARRAKQNRRVKSGPEIVSALRRYFEGEPSVTLVFLFGSSVSGRQSDESDIDVAVYLSDPSQESRIWRDLTQRLQSTVDLVCMNEAPATLNSAVFKAGVPLVIRDRHLYWRLCLDQTLAAEDFAEFAREYAAVMRRSVSLSPEDETRVRERLAFLQAELDELDAFKTITREDYLSDSSKRRNLERWAENIINTTIDVSKIILAAEHRPMPRTYQAGLETFARVAGVSAEDAITLSSFARLRNLLAHEYLEVLCERIGAFINEFPPIYGKLAQYLDTYLEQARGNSTGGVRISSSESRLDHRGWGRNRYRSRGQCEDFRPYASWPVRRGGDRYRYRAVFPQSPRSRKRSGWFRAGAE